MSLLYRIPLETVINRQIPAGFECFILVWGKKTLDIYKEV
jgi:hypothetical protein